MIDRPPEDRDCSRRVYVLLASLVMVLATLLRMAGIGTWSFASDELGTMLEIDIFTARGAEVVNDPDANVPKMIPVGMLIHHVGHLLFGRDEGGSRTIVALCGLLQIATLAVGLPRMIGRTNSLIGCVILTLLPEHIFYCQYHRFYAPAGFFVTLSMMVAWHAIAGQSLRWFVVALACSWLAVLTQTLTGSVVGSLLLAAFVCRSRGGSWRFVLAAFINTMLMGMFAVLYLYPLGKGKAVGYMWVGDTVPQAIMSGVIQLGFPVALATLPGVLLLWVRQSTTCRFLAAFGLAWLGTMLVLPKAIPFHSAYLFPLHVPCVIVAGYAVGESIKALTVNYPRIALVWGSCFMLINFPSLVSYYQDGNRHDFRAAADLVVQLKQPQDRIAFVQGDKFQYYQPALKGQWERLPPTNYQPWASERKPENGRLWIIVPGGRSGVPDVWKAWLEKNARLRTTVKHRRYDYHDFIIFFYTLEDV